MLKIEDLEPFVIKKGMEPKHLFMEKGRILKWLVCLQKTGNGFSRIVVYDEKGTAYATEPEKFDDEDFDKMKIWRIGGGTVIINGYRAGISLSLKYWKQKEN